MSIIAGSKSVPDRVALVCGAITAGMGALVLAFWAAGWGPLTGLRTRLIPMAPNTALLFTVLGSVLVAGSIRPASRLIKGFAAVAAVFCALVAGMTLGGFATGYNLLDIDHWLFRTPGMFDKVPVGHMSPVTACGFLLAAIAVLLCGRRGRTPASVLGALTLAVGWVNLAGYLYGVPLLYGGTVIPVALPTAVALVVLGTGLVAVAGPGAWPLSYFSGSSTRARLLRRLLPVVLLLMSTEDWITASFVAQPGSRAVLASTLIGLLSLVIVGLAVAQVSRLLGNVIDQAQGALHESEERLRAFLENSAVIAWMKDEDGRHVFLSDNYQKRFQVRFEDWKGKTDFEVWPREIAEEFRRNDLAVLDGGRTIEATEQAAKPDGSVSWWQNSKFVFQDAAGKRYVGGLGVDITERKQAELAIREERDRAQSYLDIAGVIIVVLAPDGTTSLINQKGCEVLGCRPQDIIGKSWIDLCIPEQNRPAVRQTFQQLIGGEITPVEHYENPLITFDGRQRLVAWHNALLRDSSGRVVGTLSSGEDITDRRLAEAEREQLLNELAAKNKEMESLVYVASHDLRSPLVNILGFSSEMERSAKALTDILQRAAMPPEAREEAAPYLNDHIPTALHYIRASGQKMDALIEGLLRLSRTGRAALNPRRLDMNAMVARIVASMGYQAQQASASITIEPLPDCTADEHQINQVFSNLLDNALKYRDPGRPLAIRVSGRIEGKRAIYCVEDTGMGIAGAHQPRVWELFHRLDPSGPTAGEGLGLTLTQRIVDRHGGRVWLDSEPGRGSRFYVELPVTPP